MNKCFLFTLLCALCVYHTHAMAHSLDAKSALAQSIMSGTTRFEGECCFFRGWDEKDERSISYAEFDTLTAQLVDDLSAQDVNSYTLRAWRHFVHDQDILKTPDGVWKKGSEEPHNVNLWLFMNQAMRAKIVGNCKVSSDGTPSAKNYNLNLKDRLAQKGAEIQQNRSAYFARLAKHQNSEIEQAPIHLFVRPFAEIMFKARKAHDAKQQKEKETN